MSILLSRFDEFGPEGHRLRPVEILAVEQVEELLAASRRLLLVVGPAGDFDALHEVPRSALDAGCQFVDTMRAIADDGRVLRRLDVVDLAFEAFEFIDRHAGLQRNQNVAHDGHGVPSSTRWHATKWPGETCRTGTGSAQTGQASGQRARSRQPVGMSMGLGISPDSTNGSRVASGSGIGTAASSARV